MPEFYETATLDSGALSVNGFWETKARFARPGIQLYPKHELSGLPGLDNISGDTVRVLRPENVVFDKEAMQSFQNKPITVEHENGLVTPYNAKGTVIGAATYPVVIEDNMLVVPVIVYDGRAISDAKTKRRYELSAGYEGSFKYSPGRDEKYGEYDVVMDGWKGNHITITEQGKAGENFYIGDKTMGEKNNEVRREYKGVSFTFEPQSAQVFDSVCAERDALKDRVKELKGRLDETKKNVMDKESIDKMVNERALVLDSVAKISKDIKTTNNDGSMRSSEEIVLDATKASYPNIVLDGKSFEYVRALFDAKVVEVNDDDNDDDDNDDDDNDDSGDDVKRGAFTTDVKDKSDDVYEKARAEFIEKGTGR